MGKKIKKTFPGFASSLSGGDMVVLQKIVKNQYKEFLGVYRMLEESIDDIDQLNYEDTTEKRLALKVRTVDEEASKRVFHAAIEFAEYSSSKYNVAVSHADKEVSIEIELI